MQKNVLLITLLLAGFLAGCSKKDQQPPLQPVSISVTLKLAAEQAGLKIPFKSARVTISNIVTGQKYTDSLTTETDLASFNSVVPGSYNVAVTLHVSAEVYQAATGIKADGDIFYSGSANAQAALAPQNNITVELRTGGGSEDWVIKQIYYAGSDTKDGAIFRDQFMEFYNNSDHVLYADSLYICQIEGVGTPMESIDYTKGYYLPTGQWDWTRSAGMAAANANTDYMYASALFRIPGTGKTYPVQPGNSIIIAATAINHKEPYQDANGKTVSVRNPALTVDLSKADFDVYMGNQPGISPLASDLNTSVTHLAVILNFNRDLVLDNPGREGLMIFRSAVNPASWKSYKTPDNLAAGKLRLQLPKKDLTILDVVEIQQTELSKRCPKRVSLNLDAGYSFVTEGSYSSQSLLRKTQKKENGRVILQDTNNSSVDFTVIKADASKNAFTN